MGKDASLTSLFNAGLIASGINSTDFLGRDQRLLHHQTLEHRMPRCINQYLSR